MWRTTERANVPRCRQHGSSVVDTHGTCTKCQHEYYANIKRADDARIAQLQRMLVDTHAHWLGFTDRVEHAARRGTWTVPLGKCDAGQLDDASLWITDVLIALDAERQRIMQHGQG